MPLELNFGVMGQGLSAPAAKAGAPFRLAVLADLTGRANRGLLETGDDLAGRKPYKVDVDNLDKVIGKLGVTLSLPIGTDNGAVEIPIRSMDDFHPDQLYENVELFEALSGLRQRVQSKTGFPAAQKEILSWQVPPTPKAKKKRARGATLPKSGKLSDFAALIGQTSAADEPETEIDALLKQVVGPYVIMPNPQQMELLEIVDAALAGTMRSVLHHPDFQTMESVWRAVDLLTRRIETTTMLQIVIYDISAEELAADLSATDELETTGLYRLLVEQPPLDTAQGALSALIGCYTFDQTPPQAELLGRMAKLAAAAKAPFISGISSEVLGQKEDDIHPLVKEAWDGLKALEEAKYLALATPRFLLRQPYGERTDPIDAFDDFEEFTPQTGLSGMLWGHPAIVAGLLLALTYAKQGSKMNIGSVLSVNDIPYYFFTDDDGDQIALPSTERLVTERIAGMARNQGFIPMLAIKGRPEVRLGGFNSLAGDPILGPWPDPTGAGVVKARPQAAEPEEEEESSSDDDSDSSGDEEMSSDDSSESSDESSGDSDLDSLLSSLDDDSSSSEEESSSSDGEEEMDPDLAALLKELG